MDLRDALGDVFRASFDLAPDQALTDLAYRSIPQWDSVGHMRLVADIEARFGIMLDTDEVLDLSSFEKAVELVGRHVAS
ncbi:MAG TPA: acyl carrier protein [Magnetospirillum sp.]|nr:acyl carrier protein [Magnetospirillum sp.]